MGLDWPAGHEPDQIEVQVLDVEARLSPRLLRRLTLPLVLGESVPMEWSMFGENVAAGLALSSDRAYVVSGNGLTVVELSEASPLGVTVARLPGYYSTSVTVAGDVVWTTDRGLRAVDVSDPNNPILLREAFTEGVPVDVAVSAGHVFTALDDPATAAYPGRAGLGIAATEASSSSSDARLIPAPCGTSAPGGICCWWCGSMEPCCGPCPGSDCDTVRVIADGSLLVALSAVSDLEFVTQWNVGLCRPRRASILWLVDVSDPDNPVPRGIIDFGPEARSSLPYGPTGLDARAGFAYATGYKDTGLEVPTVAPSLSIIDYRDPDQPGVTGVVFFPEEVRSVTVSGGFAYVVGTSGVHVVDVSDPALPQLRNTVPVRGLPERVWIQGTELIVGCGEGLAFFDISNPADADPDAVHSHHRAAARCRAPGRPRLHRGRKGRAGDPAAQPTGRRTGLQLGHVDGDDRSGRARPGPVRRRGRESR